MEKNTKTTKKESEEVYIPDECGDTMWDAVLNQEVKKLFTACNVQVNANAAETIGQKTTDHG